MDALLFHPKLVHVPIALAVLMPLVAGGLLVAWWRRWLPWRGWMVAVGLQTLLVGSGILALRTGDAQGERVEKVVPEAAIERHEDAAEAFVWASGGVLGLMLVASGLGSRRAGLPLAAAATLGTLVVTGLGYRTGEAGGRLVYQYGAAQAYVTGVAGGGATPSSVAPAARDND